MPAKGKQTKMRISFPFDWILVNINTDEWIDEEVGTEAVQKILDSLDDIVALQDPNCDYDVMLNLLRDNRLHSLLKVSCQLYYYSPHQGDVLYLLRWKIPTPRSRASKQKFRLTCFLLTNRHHLSFVTLPNPQHPALRQNQLQCCITVSSTAAGCNQSVSRCNWCHYIGIWSPVCTRQNWAG